MLAEMASQFSPEQLDILFRKLEHKHERSVLDTTKLLDLLKRLAESDTQVCYPLCTLAAHVAAVCGHMRINSKLSMLHVAHICRVITQ